MKRLFLLSLFAVCLFLAWGCKTRFPHTTHDELGQSLFTALQKNDTAGVLQLVASEADVKDALAGGVELPEDEKAALEKEMAEILSTFKDVARQGFAEVRRLAISDGVDWKTAQYLGSTHEDCRMGDTEICDVSMTFSSGGKTWEVFIDNVGKAKSGWILGFDPIQWMGEVAE